MAVTDLPRRLAVTGAAGYIATRLIEALTRGAKIDSVLAIDRRRPPTSDRGEVEYLRLDVGDPFPDLFVGRGIDTVVHLAYDLNPGHDRKAVWRVNVGGAVNLIDACASAGVGHILYLSSTSVYGAYPDNPEELSEESPARPLQGFQYSEGKAEAEALLGQYAADNPDCAVTVLRACPVLGPNADNFIAAAFSKPLLVGVKGHDPPMQFLHEDDLVDCMLACLRHRPRGAYNLAGSGTVLWSEMAALADRRMLKLPAAILYGLASLGWALRLQSDSPARGIDFIRYRWTVDSSKFERELGLAPRHSSRQAWEAYVKREA